MGPNIATSIIVDNTDENLVKTTPDTRKASPEKG